MRAILIGMLLVAPFKLVATDAQLTYQQNTQGSSQDLDTQIQRLKKLKEYYEVSIKRANRNAWRLEFKDPGYSRQLDERVKYYKEQLEQVNKELNEKLQQKEKMGS